MNLMIKYFDFLKTKSSLTGSMASQIWLKKGLNESDQTEQKKNTNSSKTGQKCSTNKNKQTLFV